MGEQSPLTLYLIGRWQSFVIELSGLIGSRSPMREVKYDADSDIVSVDGFRVSGAVFEFFGADANAGTIFQFVSRSPDDVVSVKILTKPGTEFTRLRYEDIYGQGTQATSDGSQESQGQSGQTKT